jgi:glyoxylase-like metal-dependent hydrolase (beta-lactamase superfamily II)
MAATPFRLGRFELATVRDGLFKLDGGAMFGIVPKPVWERVAPPDARNRVQLSLNPLLVRTGSKAILVDTGIGSKRDAKWNDLYGVDHRWSVPESLRSLGLKTSDIDYVIPTHLHFDHMGGATTLVAGKPAPTFSRATHLIQRREWEAAHDGNPRTKGSYHPDDFQPLERAGLVKLLDGDEEVAPGVRIRHTNAHTPGHQAIYLESEGAKAVYLGDLMPTAEHLKPAWCMGYDLFPYDVARWKEEILREAAEEERILIFDHDVRISMGRVRRADKGYELETVAGLGPVGGVEP